MVIYHVTSLAKLQKYLSNSKILAPVRAWKDEKAAVRFSKQTGRRIILRLKSDNSFRPLEGHRKEALISQNDYYLNDF